MSEAEHKTLTIAEVASVLQVTPDAMLDALAVAERPPGITSPAYPELGEPFGLRAMLGTERYGEGIADRVGSCYEIAAEGLVASHPAAMLVHGTIHGRMEGLERGRIGHAWIVWGELVWEPIHACFFARKPWEHYARAWEERTYTLSTVGRMIADHGHYGRWHESRYR